MFRIGVPVLLTVLLAGCVKDRMFPVGSVPPPGPVDTLIVRGSLFVNEFVSTGSQSVNEFGTAEDWFEIYNPAGTPLLLEEGKWFVSDVFATPMKYALPEVTIPAQGFLVIWCDNLNTVETQIHTNFALSSAGEHLLIYYTGGAEGLVVDDYLYAPQAVPAASMGRSPDGADNWILFTTPTPGEPNQ